MHNDLPFLASLIFDTPLLVEHAKADTILSAVGPRVLDGFEVKAAEIAGPKREARAGGRDRVRFAYGGYMADGGIAVLPIVGTLIRRGSWLDAESGLMSYSLLSDAVLEILTHPDVAGLMLEMDTPGGEADGCFDFATFIRSASASTGKPVWAHANERAASAGYAIASAAEKIWIPTTGRVGSIGVLAAHLDVSEADKKAGQRWTYIHAGENKVDGNAHEPLSDGARAAIQADVDSLYSMFTSLVSQHRGIPDKKIRDTKAQMYRGKLAIEAGLADEFGTFDQALAAFAEYVDKMQTKPAERQASNATKRVELMTKREATAGVSASAPNEGDESEAAPNEAAPNGSESAPAAPAAPKGEGDGKNEGGESAPAAAASAPAADPVAAERERCAGLHSLAAQADRTFGVSFDAAEAIRTGMSVDKARERIMATAEEAGEAETTAIFTPKRGASAHGSGSQTVLSAEQKRAAWKSAFKR